MQDRELLQRLDHLKEGGVQIPDARQVFIDATVRLDRIFPGAILFPGTRLIGVSTLIGPNAKIGSEGPATVIDSAISEDAEIASGYVAGSVLLNRAKAGANSHIRSGCLLEEDASTAHAVGLKQTILTCFVTLGSLINCCDCLISGGTSRRDHSEVGSGFIHFNFTPWGRGGDKATPSLIGDVPRGVFLREEKIFIGGLSGMVGPRRVGFGSLSTAGQVIRSDIAQNRMYSEVPRKVNKGWNSHSLDRVDPRLGKNLEYIGNLFALKAWYAEVRKPNLSEKQLRSHEGQILDAALGLIDANIDERFKRLDEFLAARGSTLPRPGIELPKPPHLNGVPSPDHVAWIRSLSVNEVQQGVSWLQQIVDAASEYKDNVRPV